MASHRRRDLRLPGFDYSTPGAYFVTVCTAGRRCVLGEVKDDAVAASEVGKAVALSWQEIRSHYAGVETDVFVVMPNHMHGILWLTGEPAVEAGSARPDVADRASPPTLGRILGFFKYHSTARANELRGTPGAPLWQRSYFDHVIRTEVSLQRIREYIHGNPLRWELDRENPHRVGEDPLEGLEEEGLQSAPLRFRW
jgi:putative transposase